MTRPTDEEIKQARMDAPDYKKKEDKAFMDSLSSTEAAPKLPEASYDETERLKKRSPAPKMAEGGSVSSASARADGIAQRGKTRGRLV